jgi:hypothetical protein
MKKTGRYRYRVMTIGFLCFRRRVVVLQEEIERREMLAPYTFEKVRRWVDADPESLIVAPFPNDTLSESAIS